MVIILDFDDVCVDFTHAFCKYHNELYNTNLDSEELETINFYTQINITREEFLKRVLEFYKTEEFHNLPVTEGAQEGISKLSETDELIVISYRDQRIQELTELQAEKFFPGMISKVICTGLYLQDKKPEFKEHIAKRFNARLAVDDGIHHIEGYAKENIPALLLAKSWNRNCCMNEKGCEGHIRVKDWKEIVDVARNLDKN